MPCLWTIQWTIVWVAQSRKRRRRRKEGRELAFSSDWDAVLSDLVSQQFCWLTFSHWITNSANCGRASHTNEKQGTAVLFASQKPGCLLWFQTQPSSSATHSSNVIVKYADDTTVIGLITDNDEMAYREEVSTLTKWCQENHLSLNIDKTKELVVDYRRQSREHTPIDKTPVERVNIFKFFGLHITKDLTWSAHTDAVLKKAHQRLFFLRRLRKFRTSPSILRSFYTCTVESILAGCITAWFGNSTAGNRRALQRVVRTARHIVGGELPSLQDIYTRRCTRKAWRIIKDSSHPSHRLLSLCCRPIYCKL